MPRTEIAAAAEDLLHAYHRRFGSDPRPPVPVEEIAGRYLGLCCVVVGFGRKGILGATYVKRKMIAVSDSLLTDSQAGRRSFTYAHEIGHWVLHRQHVAAAARDNHNGHGFDHDPGNDAEEVIFCRAEDAGRSIEWQADYFAACLLMPAAAVKSAFHLAFVPDRIDIYNTAENFAHSPFCFDFCADNWSLMADAVRRAGGFDNVSQQAMIIRLQELGLIVNHTGRPLGWAPAAGPGAPGFYKPGFYKPGFDKPFSGGRFRARSKERSNNFSLH